MISNLLNVEEESQLNVANESQKCLKFCEGFLRAPLIHKIMNIVNGVSRRFSPINIHFFLFRGSNHVLEMISLSFISISIFLVILNIHTLV
jgi:hypothetical protein